MAARSAAFLVPGDIDTRTGGYEYDRRIIAGLRACGWTIDVHELDGSFPHPTAEALRHAAAALSACADGATVLVDGLAFGAMPDLVHRESSRLRFAAVVHMPLADAVGLDPETAARLEAGERRALAAAWRVVVTGQSTVGTMLRYGVDRPRITVVEPGTDPAPLARGAGDPATLHLVCVATVSRGKGHEMLVDALAGAGRIPPWRLTCAGSLERDPETVAQVRAAVRKNGFEDRVAFVGELAPDRLGALYDSADLFVLATFRETYGMAVAEALARGLPVVSTRTGAIPDLVGEEAADLLAAPGDADSFGAALAAALRDPRTRDRLTQVARKARSRLRTWEQAAGTISALFDG